MTAHYTQDQTIVSVNYICKLYL